MPSAVTYFSEDIVFKLRHPRKITQWIKKVVDLEKAKLDEINYIFCSDEFLYNVNVQYLHHNTYTDIITFDLSEKKRLLNGEIYISIDRVKENAEKLKTDFTVELNRVMIHGVLHLLGYRDKSREEKRLMREKEDSYLSLR